MSEPIFLTGDVCDNWPEFRYLVPVLGPPLCTLHDPYGDGRVLRERPFPRWTQVTPLATKVEKRVDLEVRFGKHDRSTFTVPVSIWALPHNDWTQAKEPKCLLEGLTASREIPRSAVAEWAIDLVVRAYKTHTKEAPHD